MCCWLLPVNGLELERVSREVPQGTHRYMLGCVVQVKWVARDTSCDILSGAGGALVAGGCNGCLDESGCYLWDDGVAVAFEAHYTRFCRFLGVDRCAWIAATHHSFG